MGTNNEKEENNIHKLKSEAFFLTSSARAEISDGLHKGGRIRAGPNELTFAYTLRQRDLSMSLLFVLPSSAPSPSSNPTGAEISIIIG